MSEMKKITIETTVQAPIEKVWELYNEPTHVKKWNSASDDWHTPRAENDLRAGGKFLYRMEAKDGSFGFDFFGTYDEVIPLEKIDYTLGDGRKVSITFKAQGNETEMVVTFDAESENPIEMQQQGWQAILDSFKKYTEKESA